MSIDWSNVVKIKRRVETCIRESQILDISKYTPIYSGPKNSEKLRSWLHICSNALSSQQLITQELQVVDEFHYGDFQTSYLHTRSQ